MKKEIRTIVYDESLRIEAYRFEGIVQPFPNHFHEHYVIGFVESGERCLSCRNIDYVIGHRGKRHKGQCQDFIIFTAVIKRRTKKWIYRMRSALW